MKLWVILILKMNNQESFTASEIPDVLLALTKERRYVVIISFLISKVISAHTVTTNNENDDGDGSSDEQAWKSMPWLQPEIGLLARMIHGWIIFNEETSLGLEHLGLGYNHSRNQTQTQKSSNRKRIRLFAVLYVIFPYIVQRTCRKGWSDLSNNVRSSLVQMMQSGRNEGATTNIELLRGEDRRRVYEEMRRRMLYPPSMNGNNSENIQGMAVIERVDARAGDNPRNSRTTLANDMSGNQHNSTRRTRLAYSLQRMLTCMHDANQLNYSIPHETLHNSRERQDGENICRSVGFFKWLIRLNLALFLVNGKYPSILHRICGLKVDKNSKSNVRIIAERPEYKAIGLMIIGQGFTKLVQAFVEISLDAWYSRRRKVQPLSSDIIENKVPSAESSRSCCTIAEMQNGLEPVNCSICMNTREHPAAPKSCGHVFCWKCIHHWIATVRPACPLCRSSARPQDVIALYNYSPH